MSIHAKLSRRKVLRGMLGGATVSVGLPLLDCFLDGNGTALADGTQLPQCFGVWHQALGFTPGRWEPQKIGPGYEMSPDLQVLTPFKQHINVFSGMTCFLDGHPHAVHTSGTQGILQGGLYSPSQSTDANSGAREPTIDQIIADVISARTRFRSLEVSCDGNPQSLSRRNASIINPAEISPVALYQRIFGPDFKDPNAAEFTPDVRVMLRKSALSAVTDYSRDFTRRLGTDDRARLDEYFTSLRELEKKLEIELEKPAPLQACSAPQKPEEAKPGTLIEDALANSRLFSQLLAHALACGQTQVINMQFGAALRKAGSGHLFHTLTHEEPTDEKLGYQPQTTWFQTEILKAFVTTLEIFNTIREGDRTLLDRTLLFHTTDVAFGRTHQLDSVPLFTAGSANGRIKTGIHVSAKGDPVTRVGLTLQQAFGVPASTWGAESNRTSNAITQVMA